MDVRSRPLISLGPRAQLVVIVMALTIAIDAVAIAFDLWEASLMRRVQDGALVGLGELDASDARQTAIGGVQFLALVATAAVFIWWFYAAYRNIGVLGAREMRFGTGWAVGAWFVPVLNLWRPKQIADDIWRGSDPDDAAELSPDWRRRGVPRLFALWWAAWLISNFVGNAVLRVGFRADTAAELHDAAIIDVVFLAVDIVAAVLAVFVVRAATTRQIARVDRIAAAAGLPAS